MCPKPVTMNPSALPTLALLPPSLTVPIWRWHEPNVIPLEKRFQSIVLYAVRCQGTGLENGYRVVIIQYSTQPESSGVSSLFAESGGPEIIRE